MVRPVSFKGFQKGFQGVSLRGFKGFQIFLWELCVCIKYLSLGDPAAGSGNFLTETYLCLRRLENEVISLQLGGQIMLGEAINPIKVSISQFYGIEINDFAVTVAKTDRKSVV